jgi:hypothetical protein
MKKQILNFRRWQMHIRRACVNCSTPDHAETIKSWRIDYKLLGLILHAKNS